MNLSPQEIADARKWIQATEKNARFGQRFRWFAMATDLFMVAVGVWIFCLFQDNALHTILFSTPSADESAKMIDSAMLHREIAAVKADIIWMATLAFASMFFFFIGLHGFFSTVGKWNKHRKDLLLAKVVGCWLADLEKNQNQAQ